MRGEMNWNCYEISFRLKISLRCLVNFLFVFAWIESKWNSKRYVFHIGHFDNEISNWHEIFMWTEFPKTKWISADPLDIAFNVHVRLKLIAGMDFISVISTEMNFISGDKISCKHYPKWNVHQNIGSFSNAAEMKLHVNRTCFHAGVKSQPVWVHFASHVNVL